MKQVLFAALLAAVPFASGCNALGGKKGKSDGCPPQGCPPSACASNGEYGPCGEPGYGKGHLQHHLEKKRIRRGGILEHCYHCTKPCAPAQQQCQPAPPPSAAAVSYPYYTTRGPRDFLLANPPGIGP